MMSGCSAVIVLFRYCLSVPLIILLFLSLAEGLNQTKSKRQIYREQVLPLRGGKIPEDAFRTDRLALNRLNKEGISIPDGVLLEHRHVHSHPHPNKHDPEDQNAIIKVIQRPDGRYTPPEGTFLNENPQTVDSTYLIRPPIGREETNIRTPDEQTPLHRYLENKQNLQKGRGGNGYHSYIKYFEEVRPPPTAPPRLKYEYDGETPPSPGPHITTYNFPPPGSSYQEIQHNVPPRPRYPIPVRFELPNKEVLTPDYFYKKPSYDEEEDDEENIHSTIDWASLLSQYTQIANDIDVNGFVLHESDGVISSGSYDSSDGYLFSHQNLDPDHNSLYISNDRYTRKSPEYSLSFSHRLKKSSEQKIDKFIKMKCKLGLEVVQPDVRTQCQVYHVCQKNGLVKSFACGRGMSYSTTLGRCESAHTVKC